MTPRRIALAVLVLAVGFGAGLLVSRPQSDPSGQATAPPDSPPASAAPAPVDAPLWPTLFRHLTPGAPVEVSPDDLMGKRVLVNFWGTWCAPCLEEIPALVDFQAAADEKTFTVLGVALDDPEAVAAFRAESPLNYPTLMVDPADASLLPTMGNPHGALPFSLLVDAEGRVVGRHLGTLNAETLESFTRGD